MSILFIYVIAFAGGSLGQSDPQSFRNKGRQLLLFLYFVHKQDDYLEQLVYLKVLNFLRKTKNWWAQRQKSPLLHLLS